MNTWPELLITLGLEWKTGPEASVRVEEGDLALENKEDDEEEVGVSSKRIQLSLLVPRLPRFVANGDSPCCGHDAGDSRLDPGDSLHGDSQ